jgi:hypothetical protein
MKNKELKGGLEDNRNHCGPKWRLMKFFTDQAQV